eukprot:5367716-Amphidinium_carterae.1
MATSPTVFAKVANGFVDVQGGYVNTATGDERVHKPLIDLRQMRSTPGVLRAFKGVKARYVIDAMQRRTANKAKFDHRLGRFKRSKSSDDGVA